MMDLEERIEELEREVERLKQETKTYRPIFDDKYQRIIRSIPGFPYERMGVW